MVKARIFNKRGIDRVRQLIVQSYKKIIDESAISEIMNLCFDEGLLKKNVELDFEIDDTKRFSNSYDFSKYISDIVGDKDGFETGDNVIGFWTWLVILYMNQFLEMKNNGYLVRKIERYVLDDKERLRYYRQLAYFPYLSYKKHGESSKIMTYSPLHEGGQAKEQMQKTKVFSNKKLVKMLNDRFFRVNEDGTVSRTKGFTAKYQTGSLVRLVQHSVEQMHVNYDLYETEPSKIFDLLPNDFKKVAFDKE